MKRWDPILMIRIIISLSLASAAGVARADSPFKTFRVIGFGRHMDGREYAVLRDVGMVYVGDTVKFAGEKGTYTLRITEVTRQGVKAEVIQAPPKVTPTVATPAAVTTATPAVAPAGPRDPFTPIAIANPTQPPKR